MNLDLSYITIKLALRYRVSKLARSRRKQHDLDTSTARLDASSRNYRSAARLDSSDVNYTSMTTSGVN